MVTGSPFAAGAGDAAACDAAGCDAAGCDAAGCTSAGLEAAVGVCAAQPANAAMNNIENSAAKILKTVSFFIL
jgi:hypothetical protein